MVKTEVAANSIVGFNIKKTGPTTQEWKIVDGQTVNGVLEIYDVTDSRVVMGFDGSGSIGIGTASPQRSLDVRHALSIFGTGGYTELMLRGRHGTPVNLGAWHLSVRGDVGGNNDDLKLLRFTSNSSVYSGIALQIENSSGDATFNSTVKTANGSTSAPAYSFTADTDSGMFLNGVGYLALTVAGSKQLELGGGIIYTASAGKIRSASNNGSLELSGGGATVGGQILLNGGTGDANIVFKTLADSSTATERMRIEEAGHLRPGADNAYDLGTASYRWANLHVADVQFSNENTGGNEIDGTEGSWSMQEGEDDMFLINRKSGKRYKLNLTEVI